MSNVVSDLLGGFAKTVAADIARVEQTAGAVHTAIANDIASVKAAFTAVETAVKTVEATAKTVGDSVTTLKEELYSIIDDAQASGAANTWSIDKIKAAIAAEVATMVQAGTTDFLDLTAAYNAAKAALNSSATQPSAPPQASPPTPPAPPAA